MNKLQKRMKRIATTMSVFTVSFLTSTQVVSAVDVTVSGGDELPEFIKNITNIALPVTFGITALALLVSWISWNGKDEEEKAARPFTKTLRMYVIGLVSLAIGFIILKMFNIG